MPYPTNPTSYGTGRLSAPPSTDKTGVIMELRLDPGETHR